MSHEEFVWYHVNKHAPLFRSLPEVKIYVRRYLQYHLPEEISKKTALSEYDGITEIWFDDLESVYKLFAADAYKRIILTDQEKFMDLCESVVEISK
ncbi:uncharacterized protein (TIGR02118 family) [Pedobacter cryoconitis]|uniref:Uncharacterized protein (TIGR02118 family) n=2 Tax=Pedobacter cryoconitis TaxID=188932 RepID=A0A327SKW1_9SPHI|nr:uncharacterized protein (TIGR02118 family) [Pedobacter cryoconitis]